MLSCSANWMLVQASGKFRYRKNQSFLQLLQLRKVASNVLFKRVAADLSYARGLLLKRDRLVIPKMLRYDVVKNIHEGHQGISKRRERANSAVWWPGINQQLAEFVAKCPVCTKYRQINAEPMMPSNQSQLPVAKSRLGFVSVQQRHLSSCGRLFF